MNFLLLTKSTTPVIGWLATIMGMIMDLIYKMGVHNIAACIFIFTIVMNVLMLPLTIKQQKFMKVNNIMQPEIMALQKKYQGKKDPNSQQRMMAEQQAIYEKYGAKPTGGCMTSLIQLPVLFALYQVIYRIPAYVGEVNKMLTNVADAVIKADPSGYITKLTDLAAKAGAQYSVERVDYTDVKKLVDLFGRFNAASWESLKELFPAAQQVISTNSAEFLKINSFFGSLNLLERPGLNLGILIPILAGVTQYFAAKTMSTNQDPDAPGAQMSKQMNTMMPLMSVVFCFTFPMGIGIYWVASAAVRWVMQVCINKYMDKIDVNEMIKENIEKQNAKRQAKGLPAINAAATMKSMNKEHELYEKRQALAEEKKQNTEKAVKNSTEYYKTKNANMGTIASRARMVSDFEERKNK